MDEKRNYYLDKNGKISELYSLLNCIEKIEFFILFPKLKDRCWGVFLEDINMQFNDKKRQFKVSDLKMMQEFIKMEKYEVSDSNPMITLDRFIENHPIIGLQTRFELLEPYIWEEKNGSHTGHMMTIVGRDYKFYYFVEHPEILIEDKNMRLKTNPEISMIPILKMEKALQKLCNIFVFETKWNSKEPIHEERILGVLDHIYKKYHVSKKFSQKGEDYYIGYQALKKMLRRLKFDPMIYWEHAFQSYWDTHLLMARRMILLKNIEECEELKGTKELESKLKMSIQAWDKMKVTVWKNQIKKSPDFRKKIVGCLQDIVEIEQSLFKEIGLILKKN